MKAEAHLAAVVTALGCLACPSHAQAFEKQWHLGGGLGAVNASPSDIGLGLGANAYAAYGLSDMFDLKLDLGASNHAVELSQGTSERHNLYTATLGLSYKIDVIEWIPYFGIQAGALLDDFPEGVGMNDRDLVLGGMLGLDYAVNRSFGLGIANNLLFPLGGGSLVSLYLRAEYRPGW